jgi:ADP-ribosylglycohydrolase
MGYMFEMKLAERYHAALAGIAAGDARGKMTEGYWPPDIKLRYGGRVETFMPPQQPGSFLGEPTRRG